MTEGGVVVGRRQLIQIPERARFNPSRTRARQKNQSTLAELGVTFIRLYFSASSLRQGLTPRGLAESGLAVGKMVSLRDSR